MCVFSVFCLTCFLWIAENFLSVDQSERLYLSALVLPDESARVMLRNAVRIDEERGATPKPRYLQALAEREEDDLVLPKYQAAYTLDPGNASLAIRYGCRLFYEGNFAEARARFREAGIASSQNALPAYLEAAALPWTGVEETALRESLRLIAQTNSSGKNVAFPRPLWHSKLPQRGKCFADLRRRIIDECCAPLYRYTDYVMLRAEEQIQQRHVQFWDSWLEKLQGAGLVLTQSALDPEATTGLAAGSASQCIAGIHMQLAALRKRERVYEIDNGRPSEDFIRLRVKLEDALGRLTAFENSRLERIEADERGYSFPLLRIINAFWVFLAAYCAAYVVSKIVAAGRTSWTISHSRKGLIWAFGSAGLMLILLVLMQILHKALGPTVPWMPAVAGLWMAIVLATAGAGLVYPATLLPKPSHVCESASSAGGALDADEVLKAARKGYRVAYVSLVRRYFGVVLSLFVCVVCLWVIGNRILVSMYPWQLELLTTGLADEEAEAVRQALALIN